QQAELEPRLRFRILYSRHGVAEDLSGFAAELAQGDVYVREGTGWSDVDFVNPAWPTLILYFGPPNAGTRRFFRSERAEARERRKTLGRERRLTRLLVAGAIGRLSRRSRGMDSGLRHQHASPEASRDASGAAGPAPRLSSVRRKRNDSLPVSMMCARSVRRSKSALQS